MSDEPEITVQAEEEAGGGDMFDREFCYATIRKLRAEIDASKDRGRAAFLCYAIGWIFERHLGDAQQAATHYQEALAKDPDLVIAMRALRRRVLEQGNWSRYLELVDAELQRTQKGPLRVQMLVEKAEVLDTHLDEAEKAEACLGEALEIEPGNLQALWCLENHHRSRRNLPELARALETIAEVLPEGDLGRSVSYEAARLRDVALDDTAAAIEAYESMAAGKDADPRTRAALRRLYFKEKDFKSLVRDLRAEAAHLTGREKSRVLYTVARILNDRLGELVEAIGVLEEALEADPESSLVIADLVRFYPLVGKLERLAACYREQIRLSSDSREQAALFHRLGQLYDEELRDDSRAEEALRKALGRDPENRPALTALAVFYQRRGRLDDLVALHLREAETTESPLRRALAFHRGGEILEGKGDDAKAAELYSKALEALPTFLPSFNSLERLLERVHDHVRLSKLLRDRAGREDNPVLKARILERVARLVEEQLGDREGAMAVYRDILEVDPTSGAAVGAMVRLTRDLGRWDEHVTYLAVEADLSNDDQHVVNLLLRMGEIQEARLGQDEEAIETYRRLMSIDPFYPPAIRNLGRLLHRRGMFEDLVNLHRQELDAATEPDEKSLLHYRIGRIFEEKIKDLDEAASAYKAAVLENPRNFAASWSLYRIFLKREDWLSIIDILENEANALPEGNQRALALVRIGELWEEPLQRLDMAADAHMQALRVYPGCREAREDLIRLSEQDGNWDYLADLLYQELQTSVDPDEQYRLTMQLGELALERTNNPRKAMEWYMKALALRPGSLAALRGTEHALRAAGEWRSFLEVRRKLMDLAGNEQTWLALFHGVELLGRLHERDAGRRREGLSIDLDEFDLGSEGTLGDLLLEREVIERGDPAALIRYYEARMSRPGGSVTLRQGDALERSCALLKAGLVEDAMGVLDEASREGPGALLALLLMERAAQATGDSRRVVEVNSRLGEMFERPMLRAESLARRGVARLDGAEDRDQGIADLLEALKLDPENAEAFTALVQAMGREARWQELAGIVSGLSEKVRSPQRSVEVLGTLGSLQWKQLSDTVSAIRSFNRVLTRDAAHVPTLTSLLELYIQGGQVNEAIAVSRHLLGSVQDETVLVEASLKLADLLVREDRDTSDILEVLEGILERDPDNNAILERVVSIHRRNGDLKGALDALRKLVAREQDPARRAALLVEQAEIVDKQGGGHDECLGLLGKALEDDPASERAIGLLGEVLGRSGKWSALADTLSGHLARMGEDDSHVRAIVLNRLGAVFQDHIHDEAKAIDMLRRALDIEPGSAETGLRLLKCLASASRLDEAVEVGDRVLESDPLNLDVLVQVVSILDRRKDRVRAGLLAQVAFYFDVPDELCTRLSAEMRRLGSERGLVPLAASDLAKVRVDEVDHPARRILEALGRPGVKVLRKDLGEYAVAREDRLAPNHAQGAILVAECARAARFLGIGEYEVYLVPTKGIEAAVELSTPPALLFSALVTELSETEQRILAVQAMSQLRCGTVLAHKLARGELEAFMVAVGRLADPGFGAGVTGLKRVDEMRRALESGLGRKERKDIEPLAREFTKGGWIDFEEWHFHMQVTGMRLALLACGDLGAVLDAVKKRDPSLIGRPLATAEARRDAFSHSDLATAIIRFVEDPSTPALFR